MSLKCVTSSLGSPPLGSYKIAVSFWISEASTGLGVQDSTLIGLAVVADHCLELSWSVGQKVYM